MTAKVLHAMFLYKLKALAAGLLVAVGLTLGTGAPEGIRAAPLLAKPETAQAALEKKLHGEWKGENACLGDLTLRADGTFERRHHSPGNNTLAGIWAVHWDALPPTLALTCKTSDNPNAIGKTVEVKLIRLDDAALGYHYANETKVSPFTWSYSRVKK